MLAAFLRRPGLGLGVLGLLLLALFAATGRLTPLESGDTGHFKALADRSFTEYLKVQQDFVVPYGYPLFLKWVGAAAPPFTLVPVCQLVLHWLAVYLLYRGLRGVLRLPWLAAGVAATVLFSATVL